MKLLKTLILAMGFVAFFIACDPGDSGSGGHTTSDSTPIGTMDPPDTSAAVLQPAMSDSTPIGTMDPPDTSSVDLQRQESAN